MTTLSIQPPFPIITDIDGQPLEDGYIWIGTANLPPIGNPIAVYWDAALTQPAALPVRTRGGYPVNAGTPARLYVGSDYSVLVQNKNGSTLYSAPSATERYSGVVVDISATDVSFLQAGTGAVTRTAQSKMRDFVSILDFIPESEHAAIYNGTSTYDCYSAINTALTSLSSQVLSSSFFTACKTILFPKGLYNVSQTINLKQEVILCGEGEFAVSTLKFAANIDGIVVNNYNTLGRGLGTGYSAQRSVIRNLRVQGQGGSTGRGISLRARATLQNLLVLGWAEEGVWTVATSGGSPSTEGNANCFIMQGVYANNNGSHGFLFDGADANAGVCVMCSAENNAGWGFYDSSFLGNTFVACHADANTLGPYISDDGNARSVFLGCYAETGSGGATQISAAGNVLGGLHGNGVDSSGGFSIRGQVANGALNCIPLAQTDNASFQLSGIASDIFLTFLSNKDFSSGQGFRYNPALSSYTYSNTSRHLLAFTNPNAGTGALAGQMTGGRGALQTHQLFLHGHFLGSYQNTWGGGERYQAYGDAAPTSGTWARGDIIYANNPTAGGFVGWVCVTGGTPGTWKTFGAISV